MHCPRMQGLPRRVLRPRPKEDQVALHREVKKKEARKQGWVSRVTGGAAGQRYTVRWTPWITICTARTRVSRNLGQLKGAVRINGKEGYDLGARLPQQKFSLEYLTWPATVHGLAIWLQTRPILQQPSTPPTVVRCTLFETV